MKHLRKKVKRRIEREVWRRKYDERRLIRNQLYERMREARRRNYDANVRTFHILLIMLIIWSVAYCCGI